MQTSRFSMVLRCCSNLTNNLVARGRQLQQGHPQRAMESFRAAAKLYRGPFLENIYEEWALAAREECEQTFLDCLSFLCSEGLAGQTWAEVLEHANRALRQDPLNQPFYEYAMRALLELGRAHEALALFDDCERRLRLELELEPTIELMRLRQIALLNA